MSTSKIAFAQPWLSSLTTWFFSREDIFTRKKMNRKNETEISAEQIDKYSEDENHTMV